MKELRKTLLLVLLVGPLMSLYTTFVLMNLWNWFAIEALHLPEISFWVMFGLVLMIGMFTATSTNKEQEYSFKALSIAIDACIPEDKRQSVNEELKQNQEGIWVDLFFTVISRVAGATFTLVLGWVVHTFFV